MKDQNWIFLARLTNTTVRKTLGKKIHIAEFWTKQKITTVQFALQKVPNPNALGDITMYHQHAMQGLCQSHDLISFHQGL